MSTRLTDPKVAADLERNIAGLQAAGIEPDMSNLRYVKLAKYEDNNEYLDMMKFARETGVCPIYATSGLPVKDKTCKQSIKDIRECSECVRSWLDKD